MYSHFLIQKQTFDDESVSFDVHFQLFGTIASYVARECDFTAFLVALHVHHLAFEFLRKQNFVFEFIKAKFAPIPTF